MANITVAEINIKKNWEDFLTRHPEANFLQSWCWGQFHESLNHKTQKRGFYQDKRLVGIMLSVVEDAKRSRYLTVPGGPIIDWADKTLVETFVEEVKRIAKEEACVFVRVRPQIFETEKNNKIFADLGFKNAPMHLHAELTHQLDLARSKDELLADMRKTTRYEIRQALKLGVKITISTNKDDIDEFYKLQKETAKRQGFVEFEKNFLQKQFEVFASDNQAVLYTAYLGKKKLTQAFVIFYGSEADYHYGASTLDGRKYPGAYLIQWEAIKEAKKRGLKRYNLWGVAPQGEINHRFWGVSVFKRGFGGEDVEYLHARDLVINPLAYKLNWLVESARKKIRRV